MAAQLNPQNPAHWHPASEAVPQVDLEMKAKSRAKYVLQMDLRTEHMLEGR